MAMVCFGLSDIIHLKPSTLKLLILIIHFRDPKEASLMSTPTDLLHRLKYIGKKLNTCLILEYALKPLPQGYFRAPLGAQKELVWWPPFLICFIWTKVHEKRTWLLSQSRIGIGRIILICKINHFASKSFPSRAFGAARRPNRGWSDEHSF